MRALRISLYVVMMSLLFHFGCDVQNDADAAPAYIQRGPHSASRPSCSGVANCYEMYDLVSASWVAVSAADVAAAGATQLNDSATKPSHTLWSTGGDRILNVGALGTFSLKNGSKWRAVASVSVSTFDVGATSATCPSCAALSSYGRYYVYVYDKATLPAAASLAFEVSITAPDEALFYKTGDRTRLYVGTFRENGGIIEKFTARNGVYSYSNPILVAAPVSPPTSMTALNLAYVPPFSIGEHSIPPHANRVSIKYNWKGADVSDIFIISNDCVYFTFERVSGTTQTERNTMELPLLYGVIPCYHVFTFGMTSLYLYVTGFTE